MEVREELKTTRQPTVGKIDFNKLTVKPKQQPMPSNFDDRGDKGPSLEDWELFNNLQNDDSMITKELDEDMYQKYLLICGK